MLALQFRCLAKNKYWITIPGNNFTGFYGENIFPELSSKLGYYVKKNFVTIFYGLLHYQNIHLYIVYPYI